MLQCYILLAGLIVGMPVVIGLVVVVGVWTARTGRMSAHSTTGLAVVAAAGRAVA